MDDMRAFHARTALLAVWAASSVVANAQLSHVWTRHINGPQNGTDYTGKFVLDEMGNIYSTGSATAGVGVGDAIVSKHDLAGNLLWSKTISGDGSGSDSASGIAYLNGKLYVSATVVRPTNWYADTDIATLKLDAETGATEWMRTFSGVFTPGLESSVDTSGGVAVDADGNVFTIGETWEWSYFFPNGDYCTLKYSPDGDLLWSSKYHGGATYIAISDHPYLVAATPEGDVVVSGDSPGPSNASEFGTVKYDGQTGAILWVNRSGSVDLAMRGTPRSMRLGKDGRVFVAGRVFNDQTGVICHDPVTGVPVWYWHAPVGHQGLGLEGAFVLATNDDPLIGVSFDPDADDSNLNNNTRLLRLRASDGVELWRRDYGDAVFGNLELTRAVAATHDGGAVLIAKGALSPYVFRTLLLRYDAAGNLLQSYIHTPLPFALESRQGLVYGRSLVFSADGLGPGGTQDITLLRFQLPLLPLIRAGSTR